VKQFNFKINNSKINKHAQLDDVGVSEELQILDFPPNFPHHRETLDFLSVEDFHSHLVLRHLVLTN